MKFGKMYIPDKGDLVWLSFNPQLGHEQAGKRPAVVLSPYEYNRKTNLAIFCPITSHEKNYPFEVKISSKKIHGVVLSDQIKNLDWSKRSIEYVDNCDQNTLLEIEDRIQLLIAV